ncbi:hypothetical protein Tco_0953764, partial [Tanacetum coccineum]
MRSFGYGVLDLLVVDDFIKLGHGYAVFANVNTAQAMVLNSSKSWDTEYLSRMIRRIGCQNQLVSVHELDAMVKQLGYDGVDEPMYYYYLRLMTDLDVGLLALGSDEDVHSLSYLICNFKVIEVFIEYRITTLNYFYMSNSQIRATIEEYQKDIGVEASSASPKKNELLMLEWYDNNTPANASSNIGSVTPKSIPRRLFSHSCDETMIPYTQLWLSHEATFGIDNLDPLPPLDLNIPAHVSTDEGILSDHTKVQDRLGEELSNENEPDDVNHASVNKDNHHGYTYRVDEHLDNDNAPLENAALIGEDIQHDSYPQDFEYDADSSENEEANDYADSDYQFTNIGVSSEVSDNVFMEKDGYEIDINDFDTDSGGEGHCPGGRRSALNKLKKAFMQGEGNGSKYGFYCGQGFASSKEVKDRVYLHSIKTRRELKLVRNNKLRVRATCFGKTLVYATASHGADVDVGGEMDGKCNCPWVNPGIPMKAVQDILQRELEVHISISKDFRAKTKADKEIKDKRVSFKQSNMYTLVQNTAATTTVSFEKCMNELKSLKVRAHAWLSKLPANHLSMAHFSSRAHTDILLNNL